MESEKKNHITFQEYVDNIYNINTLGPYDYMEFCKKMREPIFKQLLYEKYIIEINK
jgi:hypothetical protein